jgi:hypothetical protein
LSALSLGLSTLTLATCSLTPLPLLALFASGELGTFLSKDFGNPKPSSLVFPVGVSTGLATCRLSVRMLEGPPSDCTESGSWDLLVFCDLGLRPSPR